MITTLAALLMGATALMAQTPERVRQIRTLYAEAQSMLKNQREDAHIDWWVKTTLHHNEPAVGVVTYELEYYPLHLLQGSTDFVRGKRQYAEMQVSSFEILYEEGLPAFYYERERYLDDTYEYRVYWNAEGEVVSFRREEVKEGKKEPSPMDGEGQWFFTTRAYKLALQERQRGESGYATDYQGIGAVQSLPTQSPEGLFARVQQIYTAFFAPELAEEYDPEEEGGELAGLGKMHPYVTEDLNNLYCLCQSKSIGTGEPFVEYDIWTNQNGGYSAQGVAGIVVEKYDVKGSQVAVTIPNATTQVPVRLILTYDAESKQWLVDDFLTDQGTLRKVMTDFTK